MTATDVFKASLVMMVWANNPDTPIKYKGRWGRSEWQIATSPGWNWDKFEYKLLTTDDSKLYAIYKQRSVYNDTKTN